MLNSLYTAGEMYKILPTLFIITGLLFVPLRAKEYQVDKKQDNRVVFLSDAPLEDIEGKTDKIDGYVFWPGDDTSLERAAANGGEFYFEVVLDDLDTGIGLRNRHMRENYLETDKHPLASYRGVITDVKKQADTEYSIDLSGQFALHGIEQTRLITVNAVSHGDGYRVRGEFMLRLEEHDIEIPRLMFLKVDQNIHLSLDFYLMNVQTKD